ncbi:MAG: hypothetical protein SGPRY_001899 [Prymnesium sp.]
MLAAFLLCPLARCRVGALRTGGVSQRAEGDPAYPTVSDVVRRALVQAGMILPTNLTPLTRTKWTLASRTDKGVHAACAAASLMLETEEGEVVEWEGEEVGEGDEGELRGQEGGPEAEGGGAEIGKGVKEGQGWYLSEAAISRINQGLPAEIRVFSASRVRKRFSAREQASSRTYEYMLPLSSINGMDLKDFDALLRTFEANQTPLPPRIMQALAMATHNFAQLTPQGTHKFHNFASGLRLGKPLVYSVGEGGESWPLALDPYSSNRNSHTFRTVLCCRVHRQLSIEGAPYLLLRIAGASFVLHQIRHMVGTAIAVAQGVVPVEAVHTALKTPLKVGTAPNPELFRELDAHARLSSSLTHLSLSLAWLHVDVSPLAPGECLLLDQISWWDVKGGTYEAQLPPGSRAEMDRFKSDVIYPHIHSLVSSGSLFDAFLSNLVHNEGYEQHYSPEDYQRLRRVSNAWEQVMIAGFHDHRVRVGVGVGLRSGLELDLG